MRKSIFGLPGAGKATHRARARTHFDWAQRGQLFGRRAPPLTPGVSSSACLARAHSSSKPVLLDMLARVSSALDELRARHWLVRLSLGLLTVFMLICRILEVMFHSRQPMANNVISGILNDFIQ